MHISGLDAAGGPSPCCPLNVYCTLKRSLWQSFITKPLVSESQPCSLLSCHRCRHGASVWMKSPLGPVLLQSVRVNSQFRGVWGIRLLHLDVWKLYVRIKCKRIPVYFVYCYCQGIKFRKRDLTYLYRKQKTWMDNCHLLYNSFLHFNLLQRHLYIIKAHFVYICMCIKPNLI